MIQHFIQSETGSAAVDWVVITAAIVGLGVVSVLGLSYAAKRALDSSPQLEEGA